MSDVLTVRAGLDAVWPREELDLDAVGRVTFSAERLAALVLELAEAVDNAAADIGGSRPQLDILREAVQLAERLKGPA